MVGVRSSLFVQTVSLLIAVRFVSLPAQAEYSGGSGTAQDPYQIATAADLIALGETPGDYDKHFLLTADIDLDPNLPGRKVFDKAVIAPDIDPGTMGFEGTPFTGVFDGNAHTISHLTISGIYYVGLFGWMEVGEIKNLGVPDVNIAGAGGFVGGLVGYTAGTWLPSYGTLTQCYSTGTVSGESVVGGLVGCNRAIVTQCYSTSAVRGTWTVGGLVGESWGTVTQSYSTGAVRGTYSGGGLLGSLMFSWDQWWPVGTVSGCFWDIHTSGQTTSARGTGKTTPEMQTASTFLEAGWDFAGKTANGADPIWSILDGRDYPRLWWESKPASAFLLYPQNDSIDVIPSPTLGWTAAPRAVGHDVYLGESETAVADATPASHGIYRGRQASDVTTYDPGILEWDKTCYWRIDEVNEADPNSLWKGNVWSFTTADYTLAEVVDDFESYADEGNLIFRTWKDGYYEDANNPGNGTGSYVGNENPPSAEQTIVHDGKQSMPMRYDNSDEPWYSEAERTWETPQDWTTEGADTLTLYFRGEPNNSPEALYVGIENSGGRMAVVVHPDPNAVLATAWQKWHIDLGEVQAAGVELAAVKKMVIGVGDRSDPSIPLGAGPQPGGTGRIYIDDIRLTRRMP